jgi:hypothetical protein
MRLAIVAKKFGRMSDAELDAELARLTAERRELERNAGPFRQVAERNAAELAETARQRFDVLVDAHGPQLPSTPGMPGVDELVTTFVLSSAEFKARLDAAIAAAPTFVDGTLDAHQKAVSRLDEQIKELGLEQERRRRQAAVEEAQRAVEELEG